MEMNRFLIERDPFDIAASLCDQHIVKMPLEETQMLCTAMWHYSPKYACLNDLYKPVHQKHPCTLWAMENKSNYYFAWQLLDEMFKEYTRRYGKVHGSSKHKDALFYGARFIPEGKNTKHPQCFSGHDDCRTNEFYPLVAYRKFYAKTKMKMARYNKTDKIPDWLNYNFTFCPENNITL
jgi:hypothetical protein